MALVADSDDEGSHDEGPEDVKFGQEREKAEERKQERMATLNRLKKEQREKRQAVAERNRIQKEEKRARSMSRLPENLLKGLKNKKREKEMEEEEEEEEETSEKEEETGPSEIRKRKGPFIVRILPSEIRKPKAVSRSAADFRRDHLFGDRVKRIDYASFASRKQRRPGPSKNMFYRSLPPNCNST
ncbi:uncharacterized protein [Oscarella lobularis]|uniref:uncharacterized protein isoform X2 n=1 Tax=Oscarella lobularis TaxID=121494 RepID=UPI0033136C0B